MSFFSPRPAREKLNPRPAESTYGGSFLMNDLNWNTPNYPTQQVAGMSGQEQDVQGQIYNHATNGGKGYNIAMDHAQKTLDGGYDPRDSDFYRGYRAEMEEMRNDSNARLSRRSQLGGMTNSTPAQGIEAENNRRIDSSIAMQLGDMYENERGRMDQAANAAGNLDSQQFNQRMQADQALIKERVIEDMQNKMIYQQAYQTLMHQYDVLAPIAGGMMSYSPGTWMRPEVSSGWDKAMGMAADVVGVGVGISGMKANNSATNFWNAETERLKIQNSNNGGWAGANSTPGFGRPLPDGGYYG